MVRRLDPSRPAAEVYGLEPIKWQQDGLYFLGNGDVALGPSDPEEEPTTDAIEEIKASLPSVHKDDMRLAANRYLRAQMESFGEEWKGAEHARRFLDGRN